MPVRFILLVCSVLLLSPAGVSAHDYQKPAPVVISRDAEKWAEKTLHQLSLEEKIGQMFMLRAHAEFLNIASPDYLLLRDQVKRYHIGGLLLTVRTDGPFLLRNQPFEAASFTNRLQLESKLPLIFAADFEHGLGMRLQAVTEFPHIMAFGAAGNPQYVEDFAQIVAQEARAIGVQWNLSPVADVNSNPENPIINTRSFGEDPQQVDQLVTAYIHAARDAGMLTTAKHFPGHGETETDSHVALARVTSTASHLQSVELPPFRQAIAAGVDAVMVAHVTVPALDADPQHVASTSPAIIQDLLQQQLGFKGLVVPDAMDMNAFTRLFVGHSGNPFGRSAVEVVKAGNDMVLLPADLDAAYNAVLAAVRSGEIAESRIDASVLKILTVKAALGLHKARLVDLDELPKVIATPEHVAFGQLVADSAVTLVRDTPHLLPFKATIPANGTSAPGFAYQPAQEVGRQTVAVIFSDDVRTTEGRVFERELKARIPDANVLYVDPRMAGGMSKQVLDAVDQAERVIAAVYLIPTAGKMVRAQGVAQNTVDLGDASGELLRNILDRAASHTAVIALGSPYIAAGFPQVQTYLCTYSNVIVSETSAVKALFAEIPIRGHLPVTIPGIAARGEGIELPASNPVTAPLPQPIEGGMKQHAQ